ncbi:MAG TPA: type II secretion system F family protein [Vicinamibacterales bacterium]|nr:type II secretion system F family protein [Vicinamibacterales bacterium]
MTILLPLLGFLFVSLLVTGAALALSPSGAAAIERRLDEVAGIRDRGDDSPWSRGHALVDGLKKIGNAIPRSPAEMTKLQRRLVTAGYRGHEAIAFFFGLRVVCALLFFALFATPVFFRPHLFVALGACGLGFVLPGVILGRMAKRRQHQIRLGLPDALDLLVVSVEAGLGLDQALQRVSDELAFAHGALSDELRLINLELRAGKGRIEALHNLAERIDIDDVGSLVAMLVQTDKFGTSVAKSLRVHSDTLRTKRRQRAEEAAAKTGVKMVFPLVFCIFPAIWVVTIGPAAIKFMQVLMPITQK